MIDEELNQDSLTSDPISEPAPDEPVPELPPDIVPELPPASSPVPASPPVEVISVDELLDRLSQEGETDADVEEPQEIEEPPSANPGDTPAVELAPDTLALQSDLNSLGEQLAELTGQVEDIQAHMSRPVLTTSFQDYTVTEGMLLLLLLAAFAALCARMLKGGLQWLRS